MKTINITQDKFPILSKWEGKHLIDTPTNLVKKANPKLERNNGEGTDIRSKMLEMDLQTQSGSIWSETENQEKIIIHPSQQNYDGENGSRKQFQ